MKLFYAIAFLIGGGPLLANPVVPKAKMAGETVYAKISGNEAEVTAVYEFWDWTFGGPTIYLPVFADKGDSAGQCLADAKLKMSLGEKDLSDVVLTDPPVGFPAVETQAKLYWFKIDLSADDTKKLFSQSPVNRLMVQYSQKLIGGRFYYLPFIPKLEAGRNQPKPMNYQLVIRFADRPMQSVAPGLDWERLGDALVVYLKDRQLVDVR